MNLPGLPLASALKPELAPSRATEAALPTAGGFAEELARRAQNLGLRPQAAPSLPRQQQVNAQPLANTPAPRPAARTTRPSPTDAPEEAALAPAGKPAAGQSPGAQTLANAATPSAAASLPPSSAKPGPASTADAATARAKLIAARHAEHQPGHEAAADFGANGGAIGGATGGAERGTAQDSARRTTTDTPVAEVRPSPTQAPMPADASSLAHWLAGWQPPAEPTQGVVPPAVPTPMGLSPAQPSLVGLPPAGGDGGDDTPSGAGAPDPATAVLAGRTPAGRWSSNDAPARAEARAGSGRQGGSDTPTGIGIGIGIGIGNDISVGVGVDTDTDTDTDTRNDDTTRAEDTRYGALAGASLPAGPAEGSASPLPPEAGLPAQPLPGTAAPAAAAGAAAAAASVAALHPGVASHMAPEGPSAGSDLRGGQDAITALRSNGNGNGNGNSNSSTGARAAASSTAEPGTTTGRTGTDTTSSRTPGAATSDAALASVGLYPHAEALPLAAEALVGARGLARPEQAASSFSQALDAAALAQPQGLGASAATPGSSRGEAAVVALPTPVTDPAFREALGVQVSVLARDGIQSAELHLNPTDMGPISVRIEIDGLEAQVNFGVDHAQTRSIVEAGLPELATALREAGLTLTGGGVSDHGRNQAAAGDAGRDGNRPQDPGGQRGGTRQDPAAEPAPPPPRRVRLPGTVDLYA